MPEIDPRDTQLKRLVASVMACIDVDKDSKSMLIRRPDLLQRAFSDAIASKDDVQREALIQKTLDIIVLSRFADVAEDVSSLLKRTLDFAKARL